MKKRSRRTVALVLFGIAVTTPVALAITAMYASAGGKLARSTEETLGERLDMTVHIKRARMPSPKALALREVSISPWGQDEPIATLREVDSRLEDETGERMALEIKGASLSLGNDDARRKFADAVGRLMRRSGVSTVACSAGVVSVKIPGPAEDLELEKVEGLTLAAPETGALEITIGEATGYFGEKIISFDGSIALSPTGSLAYSLTARRPAEGLLKPRIEQALGRMPAQCIKDFSGLEVLSITSEGVTHAIREAELELTLLPMYEELGLADTYNAISTPLEELTFADGRLTRLQLVIRHDVAQFGESAKSTVSPRFLRTLVYLATGESIELPLGKEVFAFSDLELSVKLAGDEITFEGGVTRQGQWIDLAEDADSGASVPRLKGAAVDLATFAERWEVVCKLNREGWPEEKVEAPPISLPKSWLDLLFGPGSEEREP